MIQFHGTVSLISPSIVSFPFDISLFSNFVSTNIVYNKIDDRLNEVTTVVGVSKTIKRKMYF